MPVPAEFFVVLSMTLFVLGAMGVVLRKNAILVFMSVELMLNALRTAALTALITVEARISQITYLPTSVLSQSTALENLSNACMLSPGKIVHWSRDTGAD